MSSTPFVPDIPPDAVEFDVVMRGYDRDQVIGLFTEAHTSIEALEAGNSNDSGLTADDLRSRANDFDVVLRGYDRGQVNWMVETLAQRLEGGSQPFAPGMDDVTFKVALRGYARDQVVETITDAVTGVEAVQNGNPQATALTGEELRARADGFDVVFRGYDKRQVSLWIDHLANELDAAARPGGSL
ncbi:cell division septum initiation protein DivIVA [Nocardiopsis mwathae]|uniref:Cell division septum initiation protein DivIVA n=1 Tax=Nocardiopsis mwathae TaxID=1472723 RepID=A0A7W9YKP3_9ACTN|nr:DivIVA domain-containing protein [Nocardiopsis mwathae]MBB6173948.1 cell division septum initiation protein DivIVA [Nocardiopsis mwathae]